MPDQNVEQYRLPTSAYEEFMRNMCVRIVASGRL